MSRFTNHWRPSIMYSVANNNNGSFAPKAYRPIKATNAELTQGRSRRTCHCRRHCPPTMSVVIFTSFRRPTMTGRVTRHRHRRPTSAKSVVSAVGPPCRSSFLSLNRVCSGEGPLVVYRFVRAGLTIRGAPYQR